MELSISFPKSRQCLWDSSPAGNSVDISLTRLGWPRLVLKRNIIILAKRSSHGRTSRPCFFITTCHFSSDEGPVLEICRYDPGRTLHFEGQDSYRPTAVSSGELPIPCNLHQGDLTPEMNINDEVPDLMYNLKQMEQAVQKISSHCEDCGPIDPKDLMDVRIMIHITEEQMKLSCGCVLLNGVYEACPVNVIPIVPTPLARGLSGPAPLLQMQQRIRFGYLTMEETRKIILLLDSDTKAATLPLVGIWVNGVTSIHHPQVWATCVHFVHSKKLNDKVFGANQSFLLILYTLSSKPQFWQCRRKDGKEFDILTGTLAMEHQETVNSQDIVLVRLMPELDTSALPTLLQSVLLEAPNTPSGGSCNWNTKTDALTSSIYGEEMPRPLSRPFPTPQQAPVMSRSQDLSLYSLCDDIQCNTITLSHQNTPVGSPSNQSHLNPPSNVPSSPLQTPTLLESGDLHRQVEKMEGDGCGSCPGMVTPTDTDHMPRRTPLTVVNSDVMPVMRSRKTNVLSESHCSNTDERIAKQEEQLRMLQKQVEDLLKQQQQQQQKQQQEQQQKQQEQQQKMQQEQQQKQQEQQQAQQQQPPPETSLVTHKMDASTSVGVSLVHPSTRHDSFTPILPPKPSSCVSDSTIPIFPKSPHVHVESSVWSTTTVDSGSTADSSSTPDCLSSCTASGEDLDRAPLESPHYQGKMRQFSELSPPVMGESASVVGRQGTPGNTPAATETDQQLYKHLLANVQQLLSASGSEEPLPPSISKEKPLPSSTINDNFLSNSSTISTSTNSGSFGIGQHSSRLVDSSGGLVTSRTQDLPPCNSPPLSAPLQLALQYLPEVSMLPVPRIQLSESDVTMTTICEAADRIALKYLQDTPDPENELAPPQNLSLATLEYFKKQGLRMMPPQTGAENVLDIAHLRQLPKLF